MTLGVHSLSTLYTSKDSLNRISASSNCPQNRKDRSMYVNSDAAAVVFVVVVAVALI